MSIGIRASGKVSGAGRKGTVGTAASVTSGTTMAITTAIALAAGDLVVVYAAADNLSATTPTFTCSDSAGGNTWTTHIQRAIQATAAAGVAGALMASKLTNPIPAGGSITITLSGAVVARCAYAEAFTGHDNTLRVAATGGTGTSTTTVTSQIDTTIVGDLFVFSVAVESRGTIAYDVTGGGWSNGVTTLAAASGTDNARVEVGTQYRLNFPAQSTMMTCTITNTDWVALACVFQKSAA